jgi:hypothetical protein
VAWKRKENRVASIVDLAEQALLARQQLPAEFGPEAVCPSYDGLGLANAAALATHWLAPDAPPLHDQPALPHFQPELLNQPAVSRAWQDWQNQGEIKQVVFLLIDALGYDQLRVMMNDGTTPGLAAAATSPKGFFMPATTVYPSTTTTALTSAATAYAPAQHGIMGTYVYFREIGAIMNVIGFRPSLAPTSASFLEHQVDPDTLVPVPNIYRRLEQAGVLVDIVNYSAFKGSSISRFTSAGSLAGQKNYNGYITAADGFAQLRQRLQAHTEAGEKSFTYMYLSTVDSTAHKYGPLSASNRAEVGALDFSLCRELLEPLAGRSDIALIVVADHGQRLSDPAKAAWLNDYPELAEMLAVPVTGEARTGYLHLKHNAEMAAVDYINRHLGKHFLAVPQAEAVALGLFGLPGQPLGPECSDRTGDLLLVPKNDWLVRQQLTKEPRQDYFNGCHGGLSRSEMLIPFLAYRL